MRSLIRYCGKCHIYTLEETCPQCGGPTAMAVPPKFTPNDRFQKYRIKMRNETDGKNSN
ncbi:MAG: RNA-protein complex protein Nop10 [Candidatus Thermoplasmatota archaeon]|jgi:H/ACA ribonucleoprotein complex subunit 3|nr:RNA-protein complex protein Nop10 [Candidatus Thermoplasmatota archaeon]